MNKLYGEGKNGKLLACILEPGNIHKLIEDRLPIEIDLNDPEGPWKNGLPAKLTVHIFYSETPLADAEHLMRELGAEKVIDKRTPVMKTKRPHCRECHSTIEQLGVWKSDESPLWLTFCITCGAVFGVTPPVDVGKRK